MKFTLHIWRQENARAKGHFETYEIDNISADCSFLEMLDQLNEKLVNDHITHPVCFDNDCREGICGMCGLYINGRPHGNDDGVTTCQLHMRHFNDGDEIWVEPWRAKAFPVIRDLVVDRTAFDKIIQAGGYISATTGGVPDANNILEELIAKINKAGTFNQGFVQTELLSASILDMDYHKMNTTEAFDVNAFESESMQKMEMIPEIITRYRSTFYNHIFTTGYAAGYYSYTWAAVLDADAFAAFAETGDILNPEQAKKFARLLEQGGTRDAALLYQEFRGKDAGSWYIRRRFRPSTPS